MKRLKRVSKLKLPLESTSSVQNSNENTKIFSNELVQSLLRLAIVAKWFLIKWKTLRRQKDDLAIIAFGDSWFNLSMFDLIPIVRGMIRKTDEKTIDTIRWLHEFKHPVLNCAMPGNTLNAALQNDLHKVAIRSSKAKKFIILLSFGGNDLIDIIDEFVVGHGAKAAVNRKALVRYIRTRTLPFFAQYISMLMTTVANKTKLHTDEMDNLRIIMHGYDYFHPEKTPNSTYTAFLKNLFTARAIPEKVADKIVRVFVDSINLEMKRFTEKIPVLRVIDLRSQIPKIYWSEQIHPSSFGYRIIAQKFSTEIARATHEMKNL